MDSGGSSQGGSILELIGTEIIGVMSPVSICMILVVFLVSTILTPNAATVQIRTAANLVYLESPNDSTIQKIEGSLLNAAVFVVIITLVTFLLVILYYYNFTSFLKHYTRFSAFFVLSTMGGILSTQILSYFSIPMDFVTYLILLFNFSVTGVISVFSAGFPIIVKQLYMICLAIIVAAAFTQLPEYTTWILLVTLSVYDLVSVLAPGGPLKMLVELASTRNEEIPALVYEARPNLSASRSSRSGNLGLLVAGISLNTTTTTSTSNNQNIELQNIREDEEEHVIRVEENRNEIEVIRDENETLPLMGRSNSINDDDDDNEGDDELISMGRGVKLGLGDFIFYSVLVGRAAMYDLMTVYACYLAIISGLACTLMLLAVFRRALPALPISIGLGVIFYFLTKLLMEPFVVGASTNLIMF